MLRQLLALWRESTGALRQLDVCDPCVHIDAHYKTHWLMENADGLRWVTACKWTEWEVNQWEHAWPIKRVLKK